MFNRTPSKFMFTKTFSSYSVSYAKDNSGSKVPTYTLENEDIACFVSTPNENTIRLYSQRDLSVDTVIYLLSEAVYDSISIEDRIVYNGNNYQIVGKNNFLDFDKLFRIDLHIEIT